MGWFIDIKFMLFSLKAGVRCFGLMWMFYRLGNRMNDEVLVLFINVRIFFSLLLSAEACCGDIFWI